jgi:hypothetical protein
VSELINIKVKQMRDKKRLTQAQKMSQKFLHADLLDNLNAMSERNILDRLEIQRVNDSKSLADNLIDKQTKLL